MFVHGLGGDGKYTWTEDSEVLWPRDFLKKDIPHARVISFGYDSKVAKLSRQSVSQNNMDSHAADLCAELVHLRDGQEMACIQPLLSLISPPKDYTSGLMICDASQTVLLCLLRIASEGLSAHR